MTESSPQFEIADTKGTTEHYSGTVGLTPVLIPPVADNVISKVLIECLISNTPPSDKLLFSFDGGTNYSELLTGENIVWIPKGDKKQIHIKGSTATVAYQILMDFEEQ